MKGRLWNKILKPRMHPQVSQYKKTVERLWPKYTGYQLIRIGSNNDGGYLVPDCIGGIKACFSPGVCHDITLEEQLLNTYGIISHLCDPSHERPSSLNECLSYEKKELRGYIHDENSMTLKDWLEKTQIEIGDPIMLSMDIEGGEYEILNLIDDDLLGSIRIMSIEFHYLHLTLNNTEFTNQFEQILSKLERKFDVVHMKPNNHTEFMLGEKKAYTCIEVTFLNKLMRRNEPVLVEKLPNKLDTKNIAEKMDVDYDIYIPSNLRNKQ